MKKGHNKWQGYLINNSWWLNNKPLELTNRLTNTNLGFGDGGWCSCLGVMQPMFFYIRIDSPCTLTNLQAYSQYTVIYREIPRENIFSSCLSSLAYGHGSKCETSDCWLLDMFRHWAKVQPLCCIKYGSFNAVWTIQLLGMLPSGSHQTWRDENGLFINDVPNKTCIYFGDFPASHGWWHRRVHPILSSYPKGYLFDIPAPQVSPNIIRGVKIGIQHLPKD